VRLNAVAPFNIAGGFAVNKISQDVDIGTIRLNYTFGGPVVAKY
jgi:outer membrane immunogenic protein